MKTPTQSAQVEQYPAPNKPENIYLEHRLSCSTYDHTCYLDLTDAVNCMTDRARSVLVMLGCQFLEPDSRLNDSIIYNVIESVTREIEDIRIVVNAFKEAERAKNHRV